MGRCRLQEVLYLRLQRKPQMFRKQRGIRHQHQISQRMRPSVPRPRRLTNQLLMLPEAKKQRDEVICSSVVELLRGKNESGCLSERYWWIDIYFNDGFLTFFLVQIAT